MSIGRNIVSAALIAIAFCTTLITHSASAQQVGSQTTATLAGTSDRARIAGTWQGVLHANTDLRVVLTVMVNDGRTINALFKSIDQSDSAIDISKIGFRSGHITWEISSLGVSYEGTISDDGNTLTGQFTQSGAGLPLVLTRASGESVWTSSQVPPSLRPMAAQASPSFLVATIKPNRSGQQGHGFTLRGDTVVGVNVSVQQMLEFALGINQRQLSGGPGWVDTEKYDIEGKADVVGVPSMAQSRNMFQRLLEERFNLRFHVDTKVMPALVITVVQGHLRLQQSSAGADAVPGLFFSKPGVLHVHNATIQEFADLMQTTVFDRPVVDETRLQGRYTFDLSWQPDETQFVGLPASQNMTGDESLPPLAVALRQQAGLDLNAKKAITRVVVIDHINPPTPN